MTSSYQGYAKSKGFSPEQVSNANVQAIQAEGNRIADSMRRAQAAELRNLKAQQQRIQKNNDLEEQVRRQNFDRETEFRRAFNQQEQSNYKTQRENFEKEQRRVKQLYSGLSTLSTEAVKIVDKIQKEGFQRDYDDEISKILLGKVDPNKLVKQAAGEAALNIAEASYQGKTDALEAQGVDPLQIARIRASSPGRQFARDQINAQMSLKAYPSWLQQQLALDNTTKLVTPDRPEGFTPQTARTTAERAAAINALSVKYLKENGLYGLNTQFLAPTLLSIKAHNDEQINKTRQQETKVIYDEMIGEKETQILLGGSDTASKLTDYYYLLLNGTVKDANGLPYTPKAARAKMMDLLFRVNREGIRYYSDDQALAILNSITFGDQPTKPFAERYQVEVDEALGRARDNAVTQQGRQRAQENANTAARFKAIDAFFDNDWNGSEAQLNEIIDSLPPSAYEERQYLEKFRSRTTEAINDKQFEEIWSDKFARGILTLKEIQAAVGVSTEKRAQWIEKFRTTNNGASVSSKDIKNAETWIDAKLNEAAGVVVAVDDSRHSTFLEAKRNLSQAWQRAYANAVRSGADDPIGQANAAVEALLRTGQYAPSRDKVTNQAVFNSFKINPGDYQDNLNQVDKVLRQNGRLALRGNELISKAALETYVAERNLGRNPPFPRLAIEIAGRFGNEVSVIDVLRGQAEYHGITLPPEFDSITEATEQSPALKRLLQILLYKPNPVKLQLFNIESGQGQLPTQGFELNPDTGEIIGNPDQSGLIGQEVGPDNPPVWRQPQHMNPNLLRQ